MHFWQKIFLLLFASFLLIILLPVDQAAAAPVVKIILYWEPGCSSCERVLDEILPPLQSQYSDQLQVELVKVISLDDIDRLYQLGSAYGMGREQVGVPFLIIGDTALVGWKDISSQLPDLIEEHLAQGGVDTQVRDIPQDSAPIQVEPGPEIAAPVWSGMPLAWAMLIFMLAALGVAFWVAFRAFQGSPVMPGPDWIWKSIPILALIGIAIAAYLTYIEATYTPAFCGPVGDCNAVQNSRYARIFNVIPVGLFGAAGYLAILAAWVYPRLRQDRLSEYSPVAILGMAGFGTLYSIYLTYLEIFVIRAVCIWCISSALIITLILLAGLRPAAAWLGQDDEIE